MVFIRALIADDNEQSRLVLKKMVHDIGNIEVVGEAETGEELLKLAYDEEPDVIFIDIDMPGLDGISAAKECKRLNPHTNIVFVTGHPEYAIEAFEMDAVDYLVKPINLGKLMKCTEKVRVWMEYRKSNAPKQIKRLCVRMEGVTYFVSVDEIIFVEKSERKTIIRTKERNYETYDTLGKIYEQLPSTFIKTHRAYVINTSYAEKIMPSGDSYLLYFKDFDQPAYVARSNLNDLYEKLQNG